ncbi:MAG: hypothetical protein RLZZ116_1627 [Planctomycetota bacterium]
MDRSSATLDGETTELQREIDRLRADLRQLRGDFTALGGDALRAARAGINESVKSATAQGKAVTEGAGKQISAHPFMAVAAAFAIGMMLGYRGGRRD